MEIIDIPSIVNECKEKYLNQTLCDVNESVVRLGILNEDFHWHKHENEDEFFFVIDGSLWIDIKDQDSVNLNPSQGYLVPKATIHRTRAKEKTIILMVEAKGVISTGD